MAKGTHNDRKIDTKHKAALQMWFSGICGVLFIVGQWSIEGLQNNWSYKIVYFIYCNM